MSVPSLVRTVNVPVVKTRLCRRGVLAADGAFRLVARHSGKVLDVFGGLTDDLTPVIQFPWNGGNNQLWTLEPLANGYVRIVARHSGKALDVAGASLDDGVPVIQYTPHDGANQQWLLRAIARPKRRHVRLPAPTNTRE